MRGIAGVHIKARRNVTLICNRFCGWLIAASLLRSLESRQRAGLLPKCFIEGTTTVMQINIG